MKFLVLVNMRRTRAGPPDKQIAAFARLAHAAARPSRLSRALGLQLECACEWELGCNRNLEYESRSAHLCFHCE